MAKKTINVQGLEISLSSFNKEDYINITDIARVRGHIDNDPEDDPRFIIRSWLKNSNTLEFLGTWEKVHNVNFKRDRLDTFRLEYSSNAKTPSPKKWIDELNAIGIVVKSGRYGGTFVHPDIALNFCYWLSPSFQVYFIKEFQRLKKETSGLEWSVRRELSKINYDIHTEAVKDNLIPYHLASNKKGIYYASEADVLNVALYGCTAKEWKAANPSKRGNMRDYSTIHQLTVLANLESLNAVLISDGMPQDERIEKLNKVAIHQLQVLIGNAKVKRLE